MAAKIIANIATNISLPAQENIVNFEKNCMNLMAYNWNIRERFREVDLTYMREKDWTQDNKRAQIANRYGDANRFQNVTIPVVYPQVESAVTYQTSVFLTGVPLFGVVSEPGLISPAKQLEALIDSHAIQGAWKRHLMMSFRDGFKYNFYALEAGWGQQNTYSLSTDLGYANGKQGRPTQTIWQGNTLKRLDPYNTFWDIRVNLSEVAAKAEFAGYTEMYSRVALKNYIQALPYLLQNNVKAAFESPTGAVSGALSSATANYYIPFINQSAFIDASQQFQFNWLAWAKLDADTASAAYQSAYQVTTLYARILPSTLQLNVPEANTVQIWKFVIINHSVLLYAERQTNAHDLIPILMGQPLEDGLGYQTKSFAQNAAPYQDVATALMNSVIHGRRRSVSDRVLYDPSRVTEAAINADNPSAKIPVRPAAYGKNIQESVYAFPYRDDNSVEALREIPQVVNMANELNGQNKARQGQFQKGNKTLHEYEDVMANSNGRDQMVAILLEEQLFTPLKLILKTNILQFQQTGSVYSRELKQNIKIDPVALRNAVLEFKVSDGLIPSDKLASGDTVSTALQTLSQSPQLASGYNLAPMFSYLMKLQGAELEEFEKPPEQIAYEQAMSTWTNTVQMLFKQNPAIQQNQLPPQPLPAQYNYTPGAQKIENDDGNILQAVIAHESQENTPPALGTGKQVPGGQQPGKPNNAQANT